MNSEGKCAMVNRQLLKYFIMDTFNLYTIIVAVALSKTQKFVQQTSCILGKKSYKALSNPKLRTFASLELQNDPVNLLTLNMKQSGYTTKNSFSHLDPASPRDKIGAKNWHLHLVVITTHATTWASHWRPLLLILRHFKDNSFCGSHQ